MADISGYLQNIRNGARGEDVRDSIINALDKINKDNPSIIRPLNVTANGTYAGEGGIVYNPVTVNVPEGASQALSLTDINITENGEFTPDDGCAYRNITVEVPQYVNEIMVDEKVVYLEEGEKVYYALDDGYDGYSAVHVMSSAGGGGAGTFTVRFMSADGGTLLGEVAGVPFGGGAVFRGATPVSSGMRFVGWSPNPLRVTYDMEVRARFENMSWADTEIADDWVTIARNFQENPDAYQVGQWKLLELNGFTDDFNYTHPSYGLIMRLVAKGVDPLEGENGYAPSTWLSTSLIQLQGDVNNKNEGGDILDTNYSPHVGWKRWTNIPGHANPMSLRVFLATDFTQHAFPQDLLPHIKRVIKYSRTFDENIKAEVTSDPSIDWFWAPSSRELGVSDVDYIEDRGPVYYSTDAQRAVAGIDWYWTRTIKLQAFDRGRYIYQLKTGILADGTYVLSQNNSSSRSSLLGFCI